MEGSHADSVMKTNAWVKKRRVDELVTWRSEP